jgi:hypothetical protein
VKDIGITALYFLHMNGNMDLNKKPSSFGVMKVDEED